jgi:hypothetical protein
MLNDEYMEYDELDDGIRYHMYLLIMDNSHIYMFLILEPKIEELNDYEKYSIITVKEF